MYGLEKLTPDELRSALHQKRGMVAFCRNQANVEMSEEYDRQASDIETELKRRNESTETPRKSNIEPMLMVIFGGLVVLAIIVVIVAMQA